MIILSGSVQCGDPGTPPHATRAVYGTRDGMVVKYTCEEGYTLRGEQCRECSADGVWSPGLPSCQSEEKSKQKKKYSQQFGTWMTGREIAIGKCEGGSRTIQNLRTE